jgi:hypothetical protein
MAAMVAPFPIAELQHRHLRILALATRLPAQAVRVDICPEQPERGAACELAQNYPTSPAEYWIKRARFDKINHRLEP